MWLGMAKVRGGARTQAGKKKKQKNPKKKQVPHSTGACRFLRHMHPEWTEGDVSDITE